jgi:DoxX-like family
MKAKRIITIVITSIAALMVLFSGIIKLTHNEKAVTTLTNVGVGQYINWLGLMEVVFTILFLIPKTMKLGFILLSCYFGGAMATELSHNGPAQNAILPLALVWIAAFLRDRSTFLTMGKEGQF